MNAGYPKSRCLQLNSRAYGSLAVFGIYETAPSSYESLGVDPEFWLFRSFGENWRMQKGNSQIKGNLLRRYRALLSVSRAFGLCGRFLFVSRKVRKNQIMGTTSLRYRVGLI